MSPEWNQPWASARGGLRGPLLVAGHHVLAAQADLARVAGRDRLVVLVEDRQVVADRHADGPDPAIAVVLAVAPYAGRRMRVERRVAGRLGQAVALDHEELEAALEGALDLDRQRRRATDREAQPGSREARRIALLGRAVYEDPEVGRNGTEPGHAMGRDPLPVAARREPFGHHDRATRPQRRDRRHDLAVDMEEGQDAHRPVGRRDAVPAGDVLRVAQEVALREHDALRLPGRARGVDDLGRIIDADAAGRLVGQARISGRGLEHERAEWLRPWRQVRRALGPGPRPPRAHGRGSAATRGSARPPPADGDPR